MSEHYYNTNKLQGVLLLDADRCASKQEDFVMGVFHSVGLDVYLAPHQVQAMSAELNKSPLTSTRRAMTTLTNKGLLIKTDIMVNGLYGKPSHCWGLADNRSNHQ